MGESGISICKRGELCESKCMNWTCLLFEPLVPEGSEAPWPNS